MAIARPDYPCPNCGHCLTEDEIARSHFTLKCPACQGALALDAPGALTRSRGAALAGIAGMVVGVCAALAALSALGVSANRIAAWPQALRLGLAIGVFLVGIALAFGSQRVWVKRRLAAVRQQLKDNGTL